MFENLQDRTIPVSACSFEPAFRWLSARLAAGVNAFLTPALDFRATIGRLAETLMPCPNCQLNKRDLDFVSLYISLSYRCCMSLKVQMEWKARIGQIPFGICGS
jgi:hypothetical protein